MLDFRTIADDVHALADETYRRAAIRSKQMRVALAQAKIDDGLWASEHAAQIETARTRWLTGRPLLRKSLTSACAGSPGAPPSVYSAIAVDGSQIPPDRHEAAMCCVINVGSVALHYGAGERPLLQSTAKLLYRGEDIAKPSGPEAEYDAGALISGRDVDARRQLAEIDALGSLIESCAGRPNAVAFLDGQLALWSLEAEPDEMKQKAVSTLMGVLNRAERAKIPVVGFVSRPTSAEAIGALRVSLCPDRTVVCKTCSHTAEPMLPCSPIDALCDADLFGHILAPGMRSGTFRCASHVLRFYKPERNKIAFFYVKVGSEIARLETPRWVADDAALLDRCHAVALDQAQKGLGYPICLTEAHQQAVVRAPERAAFFRLVERALAQKQMPALRTGKAVAKRRPMI